MEPCLFCEFRPGSYNRLVEHILNSHSGLFSSKGCFYSCFCGERMAVSKQHLALHLKIVGSLSKHFFDHFLLPKLPKEQA